MFFHRITSGFSCSFVLHHGIVNICIVNYLCGEILLLLNLHYTVYFFICFNSPFFKSWKMYLVTFHGCMESYQRHFSWVTYITFATVPSISNFVSKRQNSNKLKVIVIQRGGVRKLAQLWFGWFSLPFQNMDFISHSTHSIFIQISISLLIRRKIFGIIEVGFTI